ncbi:MAG: hypothetical protein QXK06_00145 [Candidatus Diapherotrites archaeon]
MRALFAVALVAMIAVFFSGCTEKKTFECEKDSDCALGFNLDKCCSCIEAFHLSEFSSNQGPEKYDAEKDDYNKGYPLKRRVDCGNMRCKECPDRRMLKAVCENKKCTLALKKSPPPLQETPKPECYQLEVTIRKEMEKLNHCEKAEDCAAKYMGCPFSCHVLVNKAEDTSTIEQKMKEYNAQCEPCQYDCAGLPKDFNCLQGKCVPVGMCRGYEGGIMSREEIENCNCPPGLEKFRCLASAYCATNSMKECNAQEDCPKGESCISEDGKKWYCTGRRCGCYHNDPKHPEMQMCVD